MTFFRPIWFYRLIQWFFRIWDRHIIIKAEDIEDCSHELCTHIKLVPTEDEKLNKTKKHSIIVEKKLMEQSIVFKAMYDCTNDIKMVQLAEIPIQVNMKTLERVVIGLQHFEKDEEPFKKFFTRMKSRKLIDWERKFMDLSPNDLDDLTNASNYLDIGMTTEQMRVRYGLINDFEPEEEARMRKENRWVLKEEYNEDKVGEECNFKG